MRKLLVALMMVAFAATAFAADVTFSGSYEFNGRYTKNYNMNKNTDAAGATVKDYTEGDSVTNSYYKHTFDLWMNVQTDKDTFFKSMIEFADYAIQGNGKYDGDGDYPTGDTFTLQRAWMGHNFGSVLLEAGLMTSGSWGYAFGDNAEGSYRVKATIPVAGGKLSILTQKMYEQSDASLSNNTTYVKDHEKDDDDKYSIGYKGTFGGIMVAPKLDYNVISHKAANQDHAGYQDYKQIDFDLAAGGKFGPVNVEFEYQLKKSMLEDEGTAADQKDWDVYGLYGNINTKIGPATVGFLSAYGSVDQDSGNAYDFGDDFDSTFILGDELTVGGAIATSGNTKGLQNNGDLTGWWANAIYALYDVNDKLGLMAKFAYATSNWDDDAAGNAYVMKDAKAYEFDASATYAITKELSYYVNFGYAKVDLDSDISADDPDAIILLKHGLVLNF